MDESSLGVHKIEFMIESAEDFGNSGRVGNHTHGSHDLGEVTSGDDGGGLIVDTDLESGGAPIDELDGSLGLDGSDRGVNILGDDVTSVKHRASHIFTVSGVALGHHRGRFESGVGDFSNGELFMIGLFSGDDRGIR
jgi:hypothetical protein